MRDNRKNIDLSFWAELIRVRSSPSPIWLTKVESPRLGFSGRNVVEKRNGCDIDLDVVYLSNDGAHLVRVENLGQDPVTVALHENHGPIQARWREHLGTACLDRAGGAADIEIILVPTANGDVPEYIELIAESSDKKEFYRLDLGWSSDQPFPLGRFEFQGSRGFPGVYDFGCINPIAKEEINGLAFVFGAESLTSWPLLVTISDLPKWLTIEANGYMRHGELKGRFFEQSSPVRVTFLPEVSEEFLGSLTARLNVETNDPRPAYQRFTMELSANFEVEEPCLRAPRQPRLEVAASGLFPVAVELVNLGRRSATLALLGKSKEISVGYLPLVPGAGRSPGKAQLDFQVDTSLFPAGKHMLQLELAIEGGNPERLLIPVQVARIAIDFQPKVIDFGRLEPGQARAAVIAFESRNSYLNLVAKIERSDGLLHVEMLDTRRVRVVFRSGDSKRRQSYDGLGIAVADPSLHYEAWIPVRFEIVRPLGRRWLIAAAVVLTAVLLMLVAFFLSRVAAAESPTSTPVGTSSVGSSANEVYSI